MVDRAVSIPKDKLCILTPDNFYGVMLREATFPAFDIKVLKSSDQLQSLAVNFVPDVFLLFSDHLGPAVLVRTLIDIRFHFPKVSICLIEGLRTPTIEMLWSGKVRSAQPINRIPVMNVSDISNAIQMLRCGYVEELKKRPLTNSQVAVLRLLAEGRSNKEIAEARNSSVRAVETLLNRALQRIVAELPSSARAKMALAQRYLGWTP